MDDSERRLLHDRLDALLDIREKIEPPPPANALGAFLGLPGAPTGEIVDSDLVHASQAVREVIRLAHDIVGDPILRAGIRRTYTRDNEQRSVLRGWLSLFLPLLQPQISMWQRPSENKRLGPFDVLDALSALDAGEIRPIFVANKGKNRRANRWSLAAAKLEALVWKKRLRLLGRAEKVANYDITVAFGEQWDTIRKWQVQCEQILGKPHVESALQFAGSAADGFVHRPSGIFGAVKFNTDAALELAGRRYRDELSRSAELSRRKQRIPDG